MLPIKIMLLTLKCIFKSRFLKYGEKLGTEEHTLSLSTLELRQADLESKASQCYTLRPCLNKYRNEIREEKRGVTQFRTGHIHQRCNSSVCSLQYSESYTFNCRHREK